MYWRHERTVQFFKEFDYLNRSDVCIIAHRFHFLGDEVECAQNIVTLAAAGGFDPASY